MGRNTGKFENIRGLHRNVPCSNFTSYLALGITSAFLIFLRNPNFFFKPRLWAEEGSIYLQDALEKDSFLSSLFEPHLGYYSFLPNFIAGLVASYVPLEYAAHVTTGVSALVQIATVLAIYSSTNRLLLSPCLRFAVALLPIIFCGPWEWLNTISLQFWMATGTFFILASDSLGLFKIIYLTGAFFTGVSSLLFLPFFICRCFVSGCKNAQIAIIVCLGFIASLVQIFSLYSLAQSPSTHSRFKIEYVSNIFSGVYSMIPLGHPLAPIFVAMVVISASYLIRIGFKDIVIDRQVVPLLGYALVSIVASLNMEGGSRYALPVYCGLASVIVSGISWSPKSLGRHVSLCLSGSLLLVQLAFFFSTSHVYRPDWPNWKQQVEARDYSKDLEVVLFPHWKNWEWYMRIPAYRGSKPITPH